MGSTRSPSWASRRRPRQRGGDSRIRPLRACHRRRSARIPVPTGPSIVAVPEPSGGNDMELLTEQSLRNFAAAIIYSLLGILLLVLSFVILDKMTPGSLWEALMKDRNTAVAILFAGFAVAMAII